MIIFVGVELVIIAICFLMANYIVNNRKWLAKRYAIGRDNEKTIKEMEKISMEIVSTGRLQIDDTLDEYDIKINIQSGLIDTIEVETSKTQFIYKLVNNEKIICNKAWSKKGAKVVVAFTLWIYAFCFHAVGMLLIGAIML